MARKIGLAAAVAVLVVVPLAAATGELDPSFGNGGKVTTDFGLSDVGEALALDASGRSIVAGEVQDLKTGETHTALARYLPNGGLDPAFDGDGKVVTKFGSTGDQALAIAVQPDGKIVIAGWAQSGAATRADFLVARYTPEGALDTSFGSAGSTAVDFGSNSDFAQALLLQPDGKIVVGGGSRTAGPRPPNAYHFVLARLTSAGSLDSSFGSGGRVITTFGAEEALIEGLALDGEGRIVAVGTRLNFGVQSAAALVARYNANGSVDATFDGDGQASVADAGATDVAVAADGALLVGGSYGTQLAVFRFEGGGALDPGFGTNGVATADVYPDGSFGSGIALQSDREIVVAGSTSAEGGHDFVLARFNPNGSPDLPFGDGGLVRTGFGGTSYDDARDVAVQTNGNIVAAGVSAPSSAGPADFALARYLGVVCVVPKVKGATVARAKRLLARSHCHLGKVGKRFSRTVKSGHIVAQQPPPSTRLRAGARVRIVVSRGRKR